jgi:hypothetical protein
VFTTTPRAAAGASAPGIPCALCLRGRNVQEKLGRIVPRDRIALFEIYIAAVVARLDQAIQYSRDTKNNSKGRGVLDRPVKPDDDNSMDCFAEPVIGRAFARPVGSQ